MCSESWPESWDRSICVWGGAALARASEHERTLLDEYEEDEGAAVWCLAAWEGNIFSGHTSGVVQMRKVATEACDQKLEGHTGAVRCLAVLGTRLVSGSDDNSVNIWAIGAGASWPYERTLVCHMDRVVSLAIW
jgi:hypothetical protein